MTAASRLDAERILGILRRTESPDDVLHFVNATIAAKKARDRRANPQPGLWMVSELSSLLVVSEMTIYRLIRTGKLDASIQPNVKQNKYRITDQSVRELLDWSVPEESQPDGRCGDPQLWTLPELGGYMRFTRTTSLRKIDSGVLPAIRVGHAYRIPHQTVCEVFGMPKLEYPPPGRLVPIPRLP